MAGHNEQAEHTKADSGRPLGGASPTPTLDGIAIGDRGGRSRREDDVNRPIPYAQA